MPRRGLGSKPDCIPGAGLRHCLTRFLDYLAQLVDLRRNWLALLRRGFVRLLSDALRRARVTGGSSMKALPWSIARATTSS